MSLPLLSALVISGALLALWLLSLALKDSSIIDIFWGSGFLIIALLGLFYGEGADARRSLVAGLVTLWGLRLTLYLAWRNIGKGEDYRYRAWRQEHGPRWWWVSFFKVFALQGVVMLGIAAPLWVSQSSAAPVALGWLDGLGVAFWAVGLSFETVGDWQLARFKADPANRGQVMNRGLWRYTRHPNYFGDAMVWWGYGLIALAAGGWWALYAPAVMTLFLVRVSGVAMLERSLAQTKPGYAEYIARTNAFLPWFPKQAG